ncbi:MAG: hypothetical protein MJ149_00860 [Clostridia bacterium]|nr:hypothetical protein [Clostridia bacterium]
MLNTAIEFDIKAKPFSILDLITNPLFIAGVAAILVGAGITIAVIAVKSAKKNKKRMIADYKIDGSVFTRDDKNNLGKH